MIPLLILVGLLLPVPSRGDDFGARLTEFRSSLLQTSEEETLFYVEKQVRLLGLSPESRDFSGLSGAHSFSRIVEVAVPGDHPSTLIVAAPAGPDRAGDPGSPVVPPAALALALLADLREKPPIGLRFLFLGGEEGPPLGSRLFLQDFFPAQPSAVLYIDLRNGEEMLFQTGARGEVSPAWMVQRLLSAVSSSGLSCRVLGGRNQAFRFGLADTRGPAGEYLRANLPVISVEGGLPWRGDSNPGAFRDFFRAFLRESAGGFPEEWDRHYIFFPRPAPGFLLEEPALIGVLLVVLGSSFLYPLFFRKPFLRYLRTFRRNLWNLPIFFFLVAFFLFLGTAAVRGIAALRGTPGLPDLSPFLFFALKISITACASAISFHHLKKLPMAKNGSFYSAAAIFVLFIDVVLFSLFNLSYGPHFVGAYLAAILFSIVKKRAVKFLLVFAAPLGLYTAMHATFSLPEPEVARILIGSPVKGNLLTAFILLPFFLMLLRMDLLIPHRRKGKSGFILKIFTGFFASTALILTAHALLMNPYRKNPQPLEVREDIDSGKAAHTLSLSSPAPLGDLEFSFGGEFHSVSTRRRTAVFDVGGTSPGLGKSVRKRGFLDRETFTLRLEPPLPVEEMHFRLRSPLSVLVYDSNFPHSPDLSGRQVEFHIGRRPPVPLDIVLTLPAELPAEAEISVRSSRLSREFSLSGRPFSIRLSSTARESFILKADE